MSIRKKYIFIIIIAPVWEILPEEF